MSHALSIRYLDSLDYDRWDRFVDSAPQGSIYSTSYFLDALCSAIGTQFRILAVCNQAEIIGGVGLHLKPSRYGDIVHIRPLLYYNGLVVKEFETKYPSVVASRQAEVATLILDELEGGKYASVELSSRCAFNDPRTFLWQGWRIWPRYTYVVSINNLNQQWDLVEQNLRRLITRCERVGMRLELSEDVETFYTMYESTYRRKGVEPYIGREKFVGLYRGLRSQNKCQIYFACTPDGQRAAGQIVLMSGHPVTHTWMAGSEPAFLQTGASAFLRWKVFEDLHQRGYMYNDLTDAMNEKVARFKSQFGGRLEEAFVLYKEISSQLRFQNRVKKISHQLFNIFRSKWKHIDNSVDEE